MFSPSSIHRLKFRAGILALALVAGAALLAGCSDDYRAEDGRILIEFWHGMGGRQGSAVNEVADAFNNSQDKYRVVTIYQGGYNSLSQKLIASLYARKNPPISQMYPGWTVRFYQFGYLEPVETFINQDPRFTWEEDIQDFFPVMIEENTLANGQTGEAELVTMPFNKSVYVLYVNQTRMEELGWEQPPKTWDEFKQLAEEMTVIPEGANKPSFYGFATRPYIEDFTVQALSATTQLYDEETGEILVDSPKAEEALRFLKSLTSGEESVGYVESGYLSGPFGSEKIGMFIASTASFLYNDMAVGNNFIWNCYRVPSQSEEVEGKTLMQGTNMGIFNNHPEEVQQGAWEFIKFVTSAEGNSLWARRTGYMPVRHATVEEPEFQQHLKDDPRYANAVETLDDATFEPRVMFWETVRQVITREVEAVLLNRKTVDDALESAREAIEDVASDQEA